MDNTGTMKSIRNIPGMAPGWKTVNTADAVEIMMRVPDYMIGVMDHLPAGFMVVSFPKNGEILFANQRVLDLLECRNQEEFEELTGGHVRNMICPDDRDHVRWFIQERRMQQMNTMHDADSKLHRYGDPEPEKNGEAPGGKAGRSRAGYAEAVHGEAGHGEARRESTLMENLQLRYRVRTRTGKLCEVVDVSENFVDLKYGVLACILLMRPRENLVFNNNENDALTGLPGMREFLNYAQVMKQTAMQEGRRPDGQYIFLNLRKFRRYNQKFGLESGDRFLCGTADVLRNCFPSDFVARFGGDHFVIYSATPDVMERIAKAHDGIDQLSSDSIVGAKFGIFSGNQDSDEPVPPSVACDFAKVACDSIGRDATKYVQVYSREVAERVRLQEYVTENIDRALEQGWITVYYQPVVRSLTGQLCGFEALTRWIDPEQGFMNPGVFIGTLEESRQINKLDVFVVNEICRRLRSEMDAGHPVVPISFNLSRLDFVLCNIFDEVEAALNKYSIPRDLVRVEVTESTLSGNKSHMEHELKRFRDTGYQVWMDDFGSGYSSLNVLKDYRFDELKIDMEFLRNFNVTSREIVASTVSMAKKIYTHTLAEGVETEEQVDYLRGIGCEKLQGFFYGKPAPYEESISHCRENGLEIEKQEYSTYFDRVGMIDLQTDQPLGIADRNDETGELVLMFVNQAMKDMAKRFGYKEVQRFRQGVSSRDSIQLHRVSEFLGGFRWSMDEKDTHVQCATEGSHYVNVTYQLIAKAEGHSNFCLRVTDMTRDDEVTDEHAMDSMMRNLMMMYDNILMIHFDRDYVEARFQDAYFCLKPGAHYVNVERQLKGFCGEMVDPRDRERFLAFTDPDTVQHRILDSSGRQLIGQFRITGTGGKCHWKVFNLSMISNSGEMLGMLSWRESVLESDAEAEKAYEIRFD